MKHTQEILFEMYFSCKECVLVLTITSTFRNCFSLKLLIQLHVIKRTVAEDSTTRHISGFCWGPPTPYAIEEGVYWRWQDVIHRADVTCCHDSGSLLSVCGDRCAAPPSPESNQSDQLSTTHTRHIPPTPN